MSLNHWNANLRAVGAPCGRANCRASLEWWRGEEPSSQGKLPWRTVRLGAASVSSNWKSYGGDCCANVSSDLKRCFWKSGPLCQAEYSTPVISFSFNLASGLAEIPQPQHGRADAGSGITLENLLLPSLAPPLPPWVLCQLAPTLFPPEGLLEFSSLRQLTISNKSLCGQLN